MAESDSSRPDTDAWTWWQARRLPYNLVLAVAGWMAYGLAIGQSYAFGRPMWESASDALGMTLFLGTGFLILMGFANIAFLLGPMVEASVRPADAALYRRTALALGTWGSFAVPFAFPLANLARLIGGG
ncbi:MAG: hypothetical protein GC203_05050 [Phenylobacterium sp.]|uniref:hypothetical protein n=1 Tax=Phenylobacterium sp. TaxID=1871053 RepID=UPI0025CEEA2B|nr:hypothetical protein [Phenylobacterium sp.]MBI1197212.1 hypothetical protein [Phenylobacterium sp.]